MNVGCQGRRRQGVHRPAVFGSVAKPGALVAALLALLAGTFVLVGILLPATVEVTGTVEISAPPEAVFPLLDNLATWTEWTPWGEVESRLEGPSAGAGARRVWDDPALGSGSLTLVESRPPPADPGRDNPGVDYLVEVEDGAIRFEGTIAVQPHPRGSLVSWTERADLGWNPLLGWTALNLEDSQGRQLRESLARLKARVEGGAP